MNQSLNGKRGLDHQVNDSPVFFKGTIMHVLTMTATQDDYYSISDRAYYHECINTSYLLAKRTTGSAPITTNEWTRQYLFTTCSTIYCPSAFYPYFFIYCLHK